MNQVVLIRLANGGLYFGFIAESKMMRAKFKEMTLAGEDLIPKANSISTQFVAINAPASKVWPWLLQIGQDRGGFYSYSALENLMGCKIKNADSINSDWQHLKLGDEISMHPRAQKLVVAHIVDKAELVLIQKQPLLWSWSFNLFEENESSHLVVRTRIRWQRFWTRCFLRPLMRIGHHIMERKMLRGIKQRAEN